MLVHNNQVDKNTAFTLIQQPIIEFYTKIDEQELLNQQQAQIIMKNDQALNGLLNQNQKNPERQIFFETLHQSMQTLKRLNYVFD